MTKLVLDLYESVMKNERGWNPNDQGSVAYNGINRKYHPNWPGWSTVDKRLPAKRGIAWPDLEKPAQVFYYNYWKASGLNVDRLTDFKLAALLADMSTQHGRWKQIVKAGLQGKSAMTGALNTPLTDADYTAMAKEPAKCYKAIAAARVEYCTKVALVNEADRRGIINRANKYLKDAGGYVAAVATDVKKK